MTKFLHMITLVIQQKPISGSLDKTLLNSNYVEYVFTCSEFVKPGDKYEKWLENSPSLPKIFY